MTRRTTPQDPTKAPPGATRTLVLCGGSAGSHVLAADIGRRPGWRVRVLTSRPDAWARAITCTEQLHRSDRFPLLGTRGVDFRGGVDGVYAWEDAAEALRGADVVVLSCPVAAHRSILERVLPGLDPARPVLLGTLFAQAGFDWLLRDLGRRLPTPRRAAYFGIQRFPLLCKVQEYGRSVALYGRFARIYAAIEATHPELRAAAAATLGELFARPVVEVPSFLCCTLNMSNQLLHPGIAWGHFRDYVPGETVYPARVRFYGDLSRDGVRGMEAIYRDLHRLTRELAELTGAPLLDYLGVDPLMRWAVRLRTRVLHRRGVDGLGPLRHLEEFFGPLTFRNNRRLRDLYAPMLPSADGRGFVPDVTSRFWTDDVPHGLCVLAGLGRALGTPTPRIDALIRDHQAIMGRSYLVGDDLGPDWKDTSAPQRYGASDRAGLRALLCAPRGAAASDARAAAQV
ncbi:MAG: NAD/NADP octopine/nopaline dehydrogenase family protein [Nannocystaceae bacterium]